MKPSRSSFAKFALAATLTLGTATSQAQGIPVIDIAGLIQAVQEVLQSLQQIENQIRQIEQLRSQTAAMTGSRGLGSVLNNPLLQNYIPSDAIRIVNSVNTTGYAGLAGTARALRTSV